jgi:hypothetical protein
MRALALALVLLGGSAVAAEPKLPELNLTYAVEWKGISLGSATITLKNEGGPDCYRYDSLTEPTGMVRMFYGVPRETSDFCIRGGRVVPKRFVFHNKTGRYDSFTLDFDMAARKVRDQEGAVREVPADAQDRFGMQQAVRLWLLEHLQAEPGADTVEFSLVDDRRIKAYRFAIAGRETVTIPAGRFDTIVVHRVDDPKKTTKFWLAASRDYMPVQVEQIRNGNSQLKMMLKPQ